jgi:hypothetical protein
MAAGQSSSARGAAASGDRARRDEVRRDRVREAVAATLAAMFIVLAPVAVASAWIRGTVLSTSGYVAAVSDIPARPAVRAVIEEAVSAEARAVLAGVGGGLAGPLRGALGTGLANLAGQQTSAFLAGPAFRRFWVAANRFAHAQVISLLNGTSTLMPATGRQVTLNLIPLVSDVLRGIVRRLPAAIGRRITLPTLGAIAAACQVPGRVRAPQCIQIPLFPAAALIRLRHAYRILTATTWLALILTPLAFAGALAVSPRRPRTLLGLTAGGTLTLVIALIMLNWLQSSLTAHTPRYKPLATAILHALTSSFFNLTTWCLAACLTLAIVTSLAGPYRWAATIRRYFRFSGTVQS